MTKRIECPRCGNTDPDEATSIKDRGICRECHKKWQNGELCLLCSASNAEEPHDYECPNAPGHHALAAGYTSDGDPPYCELEEDVTPSDKTNWDDVACEPCLKKMERWETARGIFHV